MNCANCQNVLPENYGGVSCPFCGKDLPSANALLLPANRPLQPIKLNPKLFLLVFLGPPILTLLSASLFRAENDPIPQLVGLIGGGLGGLTCGIMLALRLSNTFEGRMIGVIVLGVIMVVVSITLCCFGCDLGGYQFRLN
jgi:hypothetical protein